MKKIFVSAPYLQREWKKYSEYLSEYEIVLPDVEERLEESELLELFNDHPDLQAGIVGDDNFTEKVYDISNLKFLVKWGTGTDSLKVKNNVKIYNTPSAFTVPVSETVIGMILSFLRKIKVSDELIKSGKWTKRKGKTLEESTVGIIGLGNVGSEVAKKLEIFGSDIKFYDPNVRNFKYDECSNLEDLLKSSDIVTIHCTLNETSKYLINEQNLNFLGDKILINTARGPVINQKDLENFVQENPGIKIGLDVFEEEPLESEVLRNYDHSILNPHNANSSEKYWENVQKNSIKILRKNL